MAKKVSKKERNKQLREQRLAKDAAYRKALGVSADDPLPKTAGQATSGGSNRGGTGRGNSGLIQRRRRQSSRARKARPIKPDDAE